MANRRTKGQSLHDRVVKAYADKLDSGRWEDVYADDVNGYGDPTGRGGHIPDIAAHDGRDRLLVEVETDTSDDSGQRQAFKKWARGSSRREYRGVLANSDGTWTQFESV